MKKDITRLFCLVDDFLKALEEERKRSEVAYIDSMYLNICHAKRIYRNKVFKDWQRGENRRRIGFSVSNYT